MRRDEAYLLDILIAARHATEFVAELSWEQFEKSDLHHYAVMKAIETIGEAAAKVSDKTKATHPDIPWSDMIGMRNRLVHGYFEVDMRKVWDTVRKDLNPLIMQIEPLVPHEND